MSLSIYLSVFIFIWWSSAFYIFINLVASRYPNNREAQELTKQNLKKIETDPNILNTPFMKQSMIEAEKEISDRKSQMEKDAPQLQYLCEKFNEMFKNENKKKI